MGVGIIFSMSNNFSALPWGFASVSTDYGDGTQFPIGLNLSQYMDQFMRVKNFTLTTDVGNGTTSDIVVPNILGSNVQHKLAFLQFPWTMATNVSDGMGGQATISQGARGLLGLDGKFYPALEVNGNDDSANGFSTLTSMGAVSIGTVTYYGATCTLWGSSMGSPVSVTIAPNAYLP